MNRIAAIPTGPRIPPASASLGVRASFVEDLNWPANTPMPQRKAPRPTEMWVPGPNGQWEGVTPTLQ